MATNDKEQRLLDAIARYRDHLAKLPDEQRSKLEELDEQERASLETATDDEERETIERAFGLRHVDVRQSFLNERRAVESTIRSIEAALDPRAPEERKRGEAEVRAAARRGAMLGRDMVAMGKVTDVTSLHAHMLISRLQFAIESLADPDADEREAVEAYVQRLWLAGADMKEDSLLRIEVVRFVQVAAESPFAGKQQDDAGRFALSFFVTHHPEFKALDQTKLASLFGEAVAAWRAPANEKAQSDTPRWNTILPILAFLGLPHVTVHAVRTAAKRARQMRHGKG